MGLWDGGSRNSSPAPGRRIRPRCYAARPELSIERAISKSAWVEILILFVGAPLAAPGVAPSDPGVGVRYAIPCPDPSPEEPSMKQSISLAVLSAGLSLLALTAAQSQTTSGSAPTVKVGSALGAMANSPGPSATAKNQSQKTSIGTGAATVKSSGPAGVLDRPRGRRRRRKAGRQPVPV